MGQRIFDYLQKKNILPILTNDINAEKAVKGYINGEIEKLSKDICGCLSRH